MLIQIPKDTKLYEWQTSTFWFDEEGILCSISNKIEPISLEEAKKEIDGFKKIIGDKKVCMLADVSNSSASTREVREYVAIELPKFIKAIAMVSNSALGKMLANIFLTIKTQPYPTKMFRSEKDAREWLKQYM